jgi:hypothetical protein
VFILGGLSGDFVHVFIADGLAGEKRMRERAIRRGAGWRRDVRRETKRAMAAGRAMSGDRDRRRDMVKVSKIPSSKVGAIKVIPLITHVLG